MPDHTSPNDATGHTAGRYDEWQRRYLANRSEDEPIDTSSGLPVKPVYAPSDVPGEFEDEQGWPGMYPYTRHVSPGGYRDGLWVMGQYSGAGSPAETNRRIRSLLEQGQQGFSIALDLPTQNGLDSDHPLAAGEVGRVGVPIDSLSDMEEILDGIDLSKIRQIRTTANAIGPIAVALFIAGAEHHGHAPSDFRVLLQNDVLKEYVARGTMIFPPYTGMRFSVDVIEYCARELPHWEPIEFCGYHLRDAGGNAVQELAIAFSFAKAYLQEALSRGLTMDEIGHSMVMFLCADQDLFEEVAKFRAARRIWARLSRDVYGSQRPESQALKIFSYTLGSPQTAQEPENNIIRIAYQALAAVLGGAQTLATSSFDEALGLPSDRASRLALRTQQILAYETGVLRAADPLGGSYLVENLTAELEKATRAYMDDMAERGGALRLLEEGWIATELEDSAYQHKLKIDNGEQTVVGMNAFVRPDTDEATHTSLPQVANATTDANQRERLEALRRTRDDDRVQRSLSELDKAARKNINTVAPILDAVRSYATIGEICDVLRGVWGRWNDPNPGKTLLQETTKGAR